MSQIKFDFALCKTNKLVPSSLHHPRQHRCGMLKIPDLTCTEGVRRLGGVDRVMILQKLHLCEIPDSSLSPGCTPLRPPVHPSSSQPSSSSPYGDALLPVQPSPVVLVTTRSFTANRRSPSRLFSFFYYTR